MSASPRARILVVDDDASMCDIVERVLLDAGYEVQTATSAIAALEIVNTHKPFDLVVADVMMPDMTGDEMVTKLRRVDEDLKVLYLTGYVDQLFDKKQTLWEDEAFLEKPSKPEGLVEAISLLLHGSTSSAA